MTTTSKKKIIKIIQCDNEESRQNKWSFSHDDNEHLEMQNNRLDDHYQEQIYKR